MSFLSGADKIYALRFLRLLTMPWTKTAAYKEGVIDADGAKIKTPSTSDEKKAYTIFHRLVFNIRKLLQKVPGGGSSLARYGSALYLIREHTGMSIDALVSIMEEKCSIEHDVFESVDLDITGCNVHLNESVISKVDMELIGERGDTLHSVKRIGFFGETNIFEGIHTPSGLHCIFTSKNIS